MAGKAGLKAGLIGTAAMFVLVILPLVGALLPAEGTVVVGCTCCITWMLAYAGIGALAGFFLTPPRSTGNGAGAGAIAGAISGVGAGVGRVVMAVLGKVTGISALQTERIVELFLKWDLVDRSMLRSAQPPGWGDIGCDVAVCCLASVAIGAALGTLGGLIFAAAKSDGQKQQPPADQPYAQY
jgi:hypothetical protein